ncbi:3-oxoacyl-ACP synthase III family protein [Chitinophaga barathri]|uniref:Ketoacyl-ACP synthase III n=1 Tax=Chitinophaga barathri TaxID=1647451 RepID=A0A3N4MFR0_9BACT|nr:ketoacyl-ACP synthase III [Chitinophaga barathri]RPD40517.1 ketoacyl-ACP synthase III [Chitinophaga barathri]
MHVYLRDIAYYLPEKALFNKEISTNFLEWSEEKIFSKLGINERRIAGENEYASDLAIKAAEKLFEQGACSKTDIDFLLYCTQSPDYLLPTTACVLQDKLGLRTNIGALDFNLGCSGYVYGLSLAKGLIASGMAKNVLFITAETYSKFIHPQDKSNLAIFGDAASASIISAQRGLWEISEFIFGTDGRGAENLMVKNGGVRHPEYSGQNEFTDEGQWKKNDNNLYMDGAAIFQFTTSSVPGLIKETVALNNITLQDADWFVFHQANKFMLDFIRKKIGIPPEKFFTHMENCGNTVSSSIPIALREGLLSGQIKAGQKIILAGFGVGYSWAGTLLK